MGKMTKEEELSYFEEYKKTKNFNCLSTIIEDLDSTFNYLTKDIELSEFTQDDLIQELRLYCLDLVGEFINSEFYKQIKFNTYISTRCQYKLLEIKRVCNTTKRGGCKKLVSLTHDNDDFNTNEYELEGECFNPEILELEDILNDSLTSRDIKIIYDYYVLGYSLREIAKSIDRSYVRSRDLAALALDKIRTKFNISYSPKGYIRQTKLSDDDKNMIYKMIKVDKKSWSYVARLFEIGNSRIAYVIKRLETNDN